MFELPDHFGTAKIWFRALGWPTSMAETTLILDILLFVIGTALLGVATYSLWPQLWRQHLREWFFRREGYPSLKDSIRFGDLHRSIKLCADRIHEWRRQPADVTTREGKQELDNMLAFFNMPCVALEYLGVWTPSTLSAEFNAKTWYCYLFRVESLTSQGDLKCARELGCKLAAPLPGMCESQEGQSNGGPIHDN